MAEAFRVLIVEDDHDVAQYTKTVLERRGDCVVFVCSGPFTAFRAVDEFDPDVILTDIEMPGMTGLEFMATVRASRPDIPVVVMTAHVSVDHAVGALRAQADEFLIKPIAPIDLVVAIRRLAADGRANRAAARPREFVLAIGAHPDDVEIGVGGTLSAHRSAGDTVVILTMSHGIRGGDWNVRQEESIEAAELLGARLFVEDLADTEISNGGSTIAIIERIVAEIKPTIIYTHTANDRHQDHRAVHEATMAATRGIRTIACYQSPSTTIDFRPSRFVPIDGFTEQKLALLACYRSQTSIRDYLDPDFVLSTARYWGQYSPAKYVEPLEIIRESFDLSTQISFPKTTRTGRSAS